MGWDPPEPWRPAHRTLREVCRLGLLDPLGASRARWAGRRQKSGRAQASREVVLCSPSPEAQHEAGGQCRDGAAGLAHLEGGVGSKAAARARAPAAPPPALRLGIPLAPGK